MTACTYVGTDRLSYCHGHRVEVLCITRSCRHLLSEVS